MNKKQREDEKLAIEALSRTLDCLLKSFADLKENTSENKKSQ